MSREQKNEASRQKILKAAMEAFGKDDYAVASTNSMCKNHDISKGLLFHYFKNKDELFLACVAMCLEALVDYIKTHYVKKGEEIEANLNAYFEIRHNFFQTYPEYNHLFKSATVNAPTHLREEIEKLKEPLRKLNTEILFDLIGENKLKETIQPEEVIKVILNFSEYLIVSQGAMSEEMLNQQMLGFIKMLFYGVIRIGGEEK